MNIENYVDESIDALDRMIIIEEAMEMLQDGYPLDESMRIKLESINVEPDEFTETHSEKSQVGSIQLSNTPAISKVLIKHLTEMFPVRLIEPGPSYYTDLLIYNQGIQAVITYLKETNAKQEEQARAEYTRE